MRRVPADHLTRLEAEWQSAHLVLDRMQIIRNAFA